MATQSSAVATSHRGSPQPAERWSRPGTAPSGCVAPPGGPRARSRAPGSRPRRRPSGSPWVHCAVVHADAGVRESPPRSRDGRAPPTPGPPAPGSVVEPVRQRRVEHPGQVGGRRERRERRAVQAHQGGRPRAEQGASAPRAGPGVGPCSCIRPTRSSSSRTSGRRVRLGHRRGPPTALVPSRVRGTACGRPGSATSATTSGDGPAAVWRADPRTQRDDACGRARSTAVRSRPWPCSRRRRTSRCLPLCCLGARVVRSAGPAADDRRDVAGPERLAEPERRVGPGAGPAGAAGARCRA